MIHQRFRTGRKFFWGGFAEHFEDIFLPPPPLKSIASRKNGAARRLHQKRHPVGYWSHVAWTEGFWLWSQSKWIQRHFWFKDTIFTCGWNIYIFSVFFLVGEACFYLEISEILGRSAWKIPDFPHLHPTATTGPKIRENDRGPCFIGPLVSYPSKMVPRRVGVELRHQEFWAQNFLVRRKRIISPLKWWFRENLPKLVP